MEIYDKLIRQIFAKDCRASLFSRRCLGYFPEMLKKNKISTQLLTVLVMGDITLLVDGKELENFQNNIFICKRSRLM